MTLWTAGYEGESLPGFLAKLKVAGIECLTDVRKFPVSRKPGFSKPVLQSALKESGIDYCHLESLGNPLKGKDLPPGTDFRVQYERHLETPPAQDALNQLLQKTTQQRTCILCFEKDHHDCHRDLIAAHMARQFNIDIIHLGDEQPRLF